VLLLKNRPNKTKENSSKLIEGQNPIDRRGIAGGRTNRVRLALDEDDDAVVGEEHLKYHAEIGACIGFI